MVEDDSNLVWFCTKKFFCPSVVLALICLSDFFCQLRVLSSAGVKRSLAGTAINPFKILYRLVSLKLFLLVCKSVTLVIVCYETCSSSLNFV